MAPVSALGYIGFGVRDLEEWRTYATDVLGARVTEAGTSGLGVRIDDRPYRVVLQPGDDSLLFLGLEIATPAQFEELLRTLDDAGVAYEEEQETAAERDVQRLVSCTDPAGNRIEFYSGPGVPKEPFFSPLGAQFVTEAPDGRDLGFGHVFFTVPDLSAAQDFYQSTLGFKLSDKITFAPGVTAHFLHINPRHHTIAFMQAAPDTDPEFHHFMFEVENIDMVGRALDRVEARGIAQMLTLGRHSNDHMLSFYMHTPSGFGLEYGCEGRLIDDDVWTAVDYRTPEWWGHTHEHAGA